MQTNWVHRLHVTIAEAQQPLRAKQIAIRCGCVWEEQYASVRHALRRELRKGHLSQDASGRYAPGSRLLLPLLLAALLTACAAPRNEVVLLAVTDPGGQLTITTNPLPGGEAIPQPPQTLQTPYQTAAADTRGQMRPGTTTPEAVQRRYGAVLSLLPAPGRLWTLRFDTGAVELEPESQAEVPALLVAITERAAVEVLIEGHTDQAGEDAANDALSLARAEAVRDLLVAQGLTATFVRVVGRGSRAPLLDAPGQAEAQNRRVEVLVR